MENTTTTMVADPQDVEKNKVMAILAYFGILFLVPLLAAKDSKFAKFHANQGAIVFGLMMIFMVIWVMFSFLPIPYAIKTIISCFVSLLAFVPLVFSILGIVNVLNGKMERLPLIGNFDLIK